MLSPMSGQVVEVNPLVREDGSAVETDPYGEGWLFVVRTPDLRANLSNLLSGNLVARWLEEVSARLRVWLTGGLSLSFPDGGTAVEDLSAVVDETTWKEMIREFLLTDP